jgi:hypothetical protein
MRDLFTPEPFLLIVCTRRIVTDRFDRFGNLSYQSVARDTQMFQHLARFNNGRGAVAPVVHRYSYGRRLLGLQFGASSTLRRNDPSH